MINNKITKLLFVLIHVCIFSTHRVFAGDSLSVDIDRELQKAKEFYNRRESVENLKSAISVYNDVLEHIPKSEETCSKKRAEILIDLSRCYFKMAGYYAKNNKEKDVWYETGEKYGREAMSLDPGNVGGYYWMLQNLGEHGSISKFYFLKRKSDFEDALKKAEALDNPQEPYDYSGIYRTLTAYNTPRFLWGDLDKALEYAKKMEDSPRYLSNLTVLIFLYRKVDKAKAREYAHRAVHADLSQFPETQFENSFEQKELAEEWRELSR